MPEPAPIGRLTILGRPVTKKNSQKPIWVRGKLRIIPSKAYRSWIGGAKLQAQAQWFGHGHKMLVAPVQLRATIFRAANVGDVDNYLAALFDCLQAARVVENDRLIMQATGTLAKDAVRPRVEVELFEMVGMRVELRTVKPRKRRRAVPKLKLVPPRRRG